MGRCESICRVGRSTGAFGVPPVDAAVLTAATRTGFVVVGAGVDVVVVGEGVAARTTGTTTERATVVVGECGAGADRRGVGGGVGRVVVGGGVGAAAIGAAVVGAAVVGAAGGGDGEAAAGGVGWRNTSATQSVDPLHTTPMPTWL